MPTTGAHVECRRWGWGGGIPIGLRGLWLSLLMAPWQWWDGYSSAVGVLICLLFRQRCSVGVSGAGGRYLCSADGGGERGEFFSAVSMDGGCGRWRRGNGGMAIRRLLVPECARFFASAVH